MTTTTCKNDLARRIENEAHVARMAAQDRSIQDNCLTALVMIATPVAMVCIPGVAGLVLAGMVVATGCWIWNCIR